jgi:hypothetical protein
MARRWHWIVVGQWIVVAVSAALVAAWLPAVVQAQQTNVGTGFGRGGSRFSEAIGVGFSFNSGRARGAIGGGGNGGGNGGGIGGGGAGFGFGIVGGGGSARFRITAEQSSTRSFSSESASVTVLDGESGFFAAGKIVPFVTGVIPVVGDQPTGPPLALWRGGDSAMSGGSVLDERLHRLATEPATENRRTRGPWATPPADDPASRMAGRVAAAQDSTAGRAADSLEDIRRHRSAAAGVQAAEAADHFGRGEQAEAAGKKSLALYHYKIAARRAAGTDDDLARRIERRLSTLESRVAK